MRLVLAFGMHRSHEPAFACLPQLHTSGQAEGAFQALCVEAAAFPAADVLVKTKRCDRIGFNQELAHSIKIIVTLQQTCINPVGHKASLQWVDQPSIRWFTCG